MAATPSFSADCSNLETQVAAAQAATPAGTESDPAVVNLDSSQATGGGNADDLCVNSYTIPGSPAGGGVVTIRGAGGFDGTGAPTRSLTGTNVGRINLEDLTFRNSHTTSKGGAVFMSGMSFIRIVDSDFSGNSADDDGGAVYLAPQGTSPNVAGAISGGIYSNNTSGGSGGAVAIVATGNGTIGVSGGTAHPLQILTNQAAFNGGGFYVNDASQPGGTDELTVQDVQTNLNRAGGSGGGGWLTTQKSTSLVLARDGFSENTVGPVDGTSLGSDHFGGGLYLNSDGSTFASVRDNAYQDNTIEPVPTERAAIIVEPQGSAYGGGGLALFGNGNNARSEREAFYRNSVAGQPEGSPEESEGGGLYVSGANSSFYGYLDAIAGNKVGADGEGGGAYAGTPQNFTTLTFSSSTVAGNSVGQGGQRAGLAGGGDDHLNLKDSIVYQTPMPDIGGFSQVSSQYSDACVDGGPFSGTGNICVDPKLEKPELGAIHETVASPTIDAGLDHLFCEEEVPECPRTDYDGEPRPFDNHADLRRLARVGGDEPEHHVVDMGVDEYAFLLDRPGGTPGGKPAGGGSNTLTGAVLGTSASGGRCGRRAISLVRADQRGGRVVLEGLVGSSLAGKRVRVTANYRRGGKKVAKIVRARKDGVFTAKLKRPARKDFGRARFSAKAGSARSISLRLYQSLATRSVRQRGGKVVVTGRIRRALVGRRNRVAIKRLVCGHYRTVGSARPSRSGRYVVSFKVPNLGGVALYRAESRVLRRAGSRVYVKQYARAVSISLTDQTG